MIDPRIHTDFENNLSVAVRVPAPRPQFVAALRCRFNTPPAANNVRPAIRRPALRLAGFIAGIVLLPILVALLFAGPERVAAVFRTWVGFLPGSGIVENGAAPLVLAAPVKGKWGGGDATVTEAVAESDRVKIRVRFGTEDAEHRVDKIPGGGVTPLLRLPGWLGADAVGP